MTATAETTTLESNTTNYSDETNDLVTTALTIGGYSKYFFANVNLGHAYVLTN